MHWLKLVFPVLAPKGLQNSWEVVGTVEGSVVIDWFNLDLAMLTHAQEVFHECLVGFHFLKVKHKWSEVLESCHLDPFIAVFAKLVKQLNKLTVLGLLCAQTCNLGQKLHACFSYWPNLVLAEFSENRNDNSSEHILIKLLWKLVQAWNQFSTHFEYGVILQTY